MLRAFSTAATGMNAQQMNIDVISNNLANINTTGFKRSQIDFQDLLYLQKRRAGSEEAAGVESPSGLEVGSGVRPASTVKVFTAGEMENTGKSTDIAITGDGFLQVVLPDGSIRYTRDGALQTNANGEIVTTTGYPVQPTISIPPNATGIDIGKDGTVSAAMPDGNSVVVGNMQLAKFSNPAGLISEGDNLLKESKASGTPTVGQPGSNGFGGIQSGFLEKSNVQMVKELVSLITAQRAYETNSRAIRAGDDMLKTANQIVR